MMTLYLWCLDKKLSSGKVIKYLRKVCPMSIKLGEEDLGLESYTCDTPFRQSDNQEQINGNRCTVTTPTNTIQSDEKSEILSLSGLPSLSKPLCSRFGPFEEFLEKT